jgi:hypothetical protein
MGKVLSIAKQPIENTKPKHRKTIKRALERELSIISTFYRAIKNDPDRTQKDLRPVLGLSKAQVSRILYPFSTERCQATLLQAIIIAWALGYNLKLESPHKWENTDKNIYSSSMEGLDMRDASFLIDQLRTTLNAERANGEFLRGMVKSLMEENTQLKKDLARPKMPGKSRARI